MCGLLVHDPSLCNKVLFFFSYQAIPHFDIYAYGICGCLGNLYRLSYLVMRY